MSKRSASPELSSDQPKKQRTGLEDDLEEGFARFKDANEKALSTAAALLKMGARLTNDNWSVCVDMLASVKRTGMGHLRLHTQRVPLVLPHPLHVMHGFSFLVRAGWIAPNALYTDCASSWPMATTTIQKRGLLGYTRSMAGQLGEVFDRVRECENRLAHVIRRFRLLQVLPKDPASQMDAWADAAPPGLFLSICDELKLTFPLDVDSQRKAQIVLYGLASLLGY
jgi:hypothetical protein